MQLALARGKTRRCNKPALIIGILFSFATAYGRESTPSEFSAKRHSLDFTAYTLAAGDLKLGLAFDIGLNDRLQIGTDIVSSLAGAPNLRLKTAIYDRGQQTISIGFAGTYLNRRTALWGMFRENFAELDVRVIQPQISWSQMISGRLVLHNHWRLSLGPTRARLSDEGLRWYQRHKYPDHHGSEGNQASQVSDHSFSQRTLQIQSLLGLSRDLFQLTGEIQRDDTKSIFLTSRIEQLVLEDLKSKSLRLTAAQQWQIGQFNIRLGAGLAYIVLAGSDLDQEAIATAGWHPVADLDFYWLF